MDMGRCGGYEGFYGGNTKAGIGNDLSLKRERGKERYRE